MDNIQLLADVLGCNVDAFLTTYLGLPLDSKFKEKAIWVLNSGKFEKRLCGWKSTYSSKEGDSLIKSVLSSIMTYFLFLFPLPSSEANKLEAIQ